MIYVNYALFLILGVFSNMKSNLGFIYSQEVTDSKYKSMFGTILNIFDGGILILDYFYFFFVSKDWLYLHLFLLLMGVASFVVMFILPESPKYLLSMGKHQEALNALETIAKFNGRLSQFRLAIQGTELREVKESQPSVAMNDDSEI